ncbi:MAG TPA: AAA family ATPase [Thermomicrobiales bacterium]|nr:AAA family ATPase [Thermomicrobiales bacterium]
MAIDAGFNAVPPGPRSMPIVGRERERASLGACLAETLAGRGGLALVSGAAGIGKTTLVDWLSTQALRQGLQVAAGRCFDMTLTPPYGPWIDAFGALDRTRRGDEPAHPFRSVSERAPVSSQESLYAETIAYLERVTAGGPLLLVLEDMHWCDPASVDLLRFLGRQIGSLPLLLLATSRASDLTPSHPLFQLLPAVVRESRATRIDLGELSEEDIRQLTRERYTAAPEDEARLVAYLNARSGGNPFYLTETLRTLENERLVRQDGSTTLVGDLEHAPVPPLARQVIAGRLATLDDDARDLLGVAAIIGLHVPRDLLQALGGVDPVELARTLERALAANLIEDSSGASGFDFEHALVWETIYDAQPVPARQATHRRTAELLAARPDPLSSAVAAHFERADDPRAVDWLIASGDEALAMYAARDAAAAFSRASGLAARHARELPLDVLRSRARAYDLLGEFDSARRDLETVLDRSRVAGDPLTQWYALAELSQLWSARDYERAGTISRAALELARDIDDPALIAHSLNRVANWHGNVDEADVALGLHEEALRIFEGIGDRYGIADTLDMLGMANYLSCDLHASAACYERAIPIFRELDDRQRLATCLAAMAFNGGDHDASVTAPVFREASFWVGCGEESLAIARDIGWQSGEAFALFALAATSAMQGNHGRAAREASEMLAIAERIGHREWQAAAHQVLGTLWLDLLAVSRSHDEFERGLAIARGAGARLWIVYLLASLALCYTEDGDLTAADAVLQTVLQPDRPRWLTGQRGCWNVWVRIELRRRDPERALELLDRLSAPRTEDAAARDIPHLLALRGEALALLNRDQEAEQTLASARRLAALFGFRPLLWRVDAIRGDLFQASGRKEEADAARHAARATIDEIAATIEDATTREQFRERAYVRAPLAQRVAAHPAVPGLTPRELDVLRLLVEGKSDREIADALYISPRTVMRHVTGILTKLDVSSRTAAATLAIRHELV